jgi:hypothetical protein
MILYHGTSERYLSNIMHRGLLSRCITGNPDNWPEHPAHPEYIYLTNCYSPYFAQACANNVDGEGEKWVIVEVDVDEGTLLPDEDFLEQINRHDAGKSMKEATAFFKQNLRKYRDHALHSLTHLGTVCTDYTIPPEKITRVAVYDWRSNRPLSWMAADPCITLLNHKFMASKYESLTRWFFEPNITAEQLCMGTWDIYSDEMKQAWQGYIANRAGLTLIRVR